MVMSGHVRAHAVRRVNDTANSPLHPLHPDVASHGDAGGDNQCWGKSCTIVDPGSSPLGAGKGGKLWPVMAHRCPVHFSGGSMGSDFLSRCAGTRHARGGACFALLPTGETMS